MGKDKILIIGNGAREHALAWALKRSPQVGKIYVAPGNGGTRRIAQNVPITANDIRALAAFAKEKRIDFTIVGPEKTLSLGIVDLFRAKHMRIFGPTAMAARIESSKVFSKQLMKQIHVPTAPYAIFSSYPKALAYCQQNTRKFVIKADGLAAGKGAYICSTFYKARKALKEIMLDKIFGDAGKRVIIENYIPGQEISIHSLSDGKNAFMLPPSKDFKRLLENDKGQNTGGMGAIAPIDWFGQDKMFHVEQTIVQPIINSMSGENTPFTGCLYPGLMISGGNPYVLEFNSRFGDPECQVLMRLLEHTDVYELLTASFDGTIKTMNVPRETGYAACVVLCARNYPNSTKETPLIEGLEIADSISDIRIFHGGTSYENGSIHATDGRILSVTAKAVTLDAAIHRVYETIHNHIRFDGMKYRQDIGSKKRG